MNRDEVRNIIEATLRGGDKTPGLFDLPRIMGIRSEIQSCTSINDVIGIIEKHRSLLSKAFGLRDEVIEQTMKKLSALES
ncbi:MAG: hypothetical protein HY016_00135 [Nitrosomonadales bacterium]|nr:hypothetical protein [Nitrosomonadales bacterium]